MPALSKHHASELTKCLVIGDSGTGKTGALASLAKAGYNLRIVDMDNGVDILLNLLRSDADAISRVHYRTFTDQFKNQGGRLVPKTAKAWEEMSKFLADWKDEDADFGNIYTWTPKEVLVIDSLTMLGNSAMRRILFLNNRLVEAPHQSDWGQAQTLVENLLAMLYSDDLKCNVIVNAHISYQEVQDVTKGYPAAPGRALSPKVGRYFNSMVQTITAGAGAARKHYISTKPMGLIDLKTTNPGKVKERYPIETGLADFFKDVQGNG